MTITDHCGNLSLKGGSMKSLSSPPRVVTRGTSPHSAPMTAMAVMTSPMILRLPADMPGLSGAPLGGR